VRPALALRRALGKPHLRVMAVDDGPFSRRQRWAPVALVAVSSPDYVEAVGVGRVRVDGVDGTSAVASLADGCPQRASVRVLLVDGVVLGGFNVLDLSRLSRLTGMSVISLTRRRPDFPAMRAALVKYFPRDSARRWRLLRAHRLFRVPTSGHPIYAAAVGCYRADALEVVRRTTLRGFWPEPLRLARLVARAASAASGRPAAAAAGTLRARGAV